MKRIFILLCVAIPFTLMAQDVQEINRLLEYRRYETAKQKAAAMVEADRNNGVYRYWLAQVYSNAKDSAALVNMQLPSTGDAWMKLAQGNILLAKGDVGGARILFDEAIGNRRKKDPAVVAAAARTNIYNTNGDRNYAIDLLHQLIKKDRHNPELYTMLGDAWFRLKNGSEAYTAYQDALKADPSYAPALFELGKIFATQNNESLYLKYYTDAVQVDPAFAPAWYELYYQFYHKDIGKAYDYYTKYLAVADRKASDEYQLTDLLYLTRQYDKAISKATQLLLQKDADNRLNKLLAYTYKAKEEPGKAIGYMLRYFNNGADTSYLLKDYETMADIYQKAGKPDSATSWYIRALPIVRDSSVMVKYYKKLADHYKQKKDYANQAIWAGNYYRYSNRVTNVDLFNWGIACYMAGDYRNADSVFGAYSVKYPDHVFGPYWQARANAAIDTTMTLGLAVPYYEKMISIAEKDTASATNKRYLAEAYGYIATYVANEKKDYPAAIDYFEKLLEVDPGNADAKKYIDILEKSVANSNASAGK